MRPAVGAKLSRGTTDFLIVIVNTVAKIVMKMTKQLMQ